MVRSLRTAMLKSMLDSMLSLKAGFKDTSELTPKRNRVLSLIANRLGNLIINRLRKVIANRLLKLVLNQVFNRRRNLMSNRLANQVMSRLVNRLRHCLANLVGNHLFNRQVKHLRKLDGKCEFSRQVHGHPGGSLGGRPLISPALYQVQSIRYGR